MHSLVVDDWCALAVNITDSISVAMLLDNACWRYQLHASNSSCHVIHAASHSNRRSQIVSARWGLSNVDRTWCNGYFNFVLLHKVCSLSLKARCAILKARMCIVNLVVLWNTITGAAKKIMFQTQNAIIFRGASPLIPWTLLGAMPQTRARHAKMDMKHFWCHTYIACMYL